MIRIPHAGSRVSVAGRPADVLVVADGSIIVFRFEDTQEVFCVASHSWPFAGPIHPIDEHAHWQRRPQQGEEWEQSGVGDVGIIANAVDALTGRHEIIYRNRETQEVHRMDADSWFEAVHGIQRFRRKERLSPGHPT